MPATPLGKRSARCPPARIPDRRLGFAAWLRPVTYPRPQAADATPVAMWSGPPERVSATPVLGRPVSGTPVSWGVLSTARGSRRPASGSRRPASADARSDLVTDARQPRARCREGGEAVGPAKAAAPVLAPGLGAAEHAESGADWPRSSRGRALAVRDVPHRAGACRSWLSRRRRARWRTRRRGPSLSRAAAARDRPRSLPIPVACPASQVPAGLVPAGLVPAGLAPAGHAVAPSDSRRVPAPDC